MIINMNGAKAPETSSPVLQEKTITPETLPTVVGADEGYDGLSQVTVNPDSQLKAENIRSGKTIFGVDGSFVGENTGDAIPNTDLISYIVLDTSFSETWLYPKDGYKLSYVQDAEPDLSTKYLYNGGMRTSSYTLITDGNSPLSVKKSYGVMKSRMEINSSTTSLSSTDTTGKVSGSFIREYTGSPIYEGKSISKILRFAEMEYGVYEYNLHVNGFFSIFNELGSMGGYIKPSEGFPMPFEGDISLKYRNDSSSGNTGIIEITGLPSVEVKNVTVGYPGVHSTYCLTFLIKELYLNTLPTKVE